MSTKSHIETAKVLIKKANDDLLALNTLVKNSEISEESLGFHAQQVIEKSIKSVLALKSIKYPFTHDLLELKRICDQHQIQVPPSFSIDFDLTPFAKEYRYESYGYEQEEPLDIVRTVRIAEDLLAWAKKTVGV